VAQYPVSINLSSLNGTNGFVVNGPAERDGLGADITGVGDINGDGFDDVAVAAPHFGDRGAVPGDVYIVFGTDAGLPSALEVSSLDGSNGFKLSGEIGNQLWTVAAAGDVNGDGFADLAVSAIYYLEPSENGGSAYVVFGTPDGFDAELTVAEIYGTNGFRLTDASPVVDATSGINDVNSVGDVNGDGFEDILISSRAPSTNPNQLNFNHYVVFGSDAGFADMSLSALDGTNGFQIVGGEAQLGQSAGDVNGDGIDDIIMGAPTADPHGTSSGAAYVVFGRASGFSSSFDLSTLSGTNGFTVEGGNAQDRAGTAVSSAGDINGDGYADVVVGATGFGPESGAAYVVFGRATGFSAHINLTNLGPGGIRILGDRSFGGRAGQVVSSVGDVNGDGFDDVSVGAFSPGSPSVVYVVFGKEAPTNIRVVDLNGNNGFKINPAATGDAAYDSTMAGDFNGDGMHDLIVGAVNADPHGADSGAAYVVFGHLPDAAVTRTGTVASQSLVGGNFDDTLNGLGGDDELFGNGGEDQLDGGGGDDIIKGGAGSDWLAGLGGEDHLEGGGDDDTLFGGGNQDLILGGAGSDHLIGGTGNDRLDGGAGKDFLIGDDGNDVFVVSSVADSGPGGAFRDNIIDFLVGSDRIDLSAIDANSNTGADDSFAFIGGARFSHTAGELRQYSSFSGDTVVAGDVDGDGAADFEVLLRGAHTLTAADFIP